MSEKTNISWADSTFNPWIGCTMKVDSIGRAKSLDRACQFCYAKELDDNRFSRTMDGGTKDRPISHWGKGAPRHITSEANWKQPLKWNNCAAVVCDNCGNPRGNPECDCEHCSLPDPIQGFRSPSTHRRRVFCASLGDWLDDEVPAGFLSDLLDLIHKTPKLFWLLLTKRPELWLPRMQKVQSLGDSEDGLSGKQAEDESIDATQVTHFGHCVAHDWIRGLPPKNVWFGVSVGDQARANIRIPILKDIPANVRFLSCEPLFEAINLPSLDGIHQVICGGESGPKHRVMTMAHVQHLHDQVVGDGTAWFMKQDSGLKSGMKGRFELPHHAHLWKQEFPV